MLSPAFADLPSEVRVDDGNGERTYVVACDEVYCRPEKGTPHVVAEEGFTTPDQIGRRARELEQASKSRFDLVLYEKGKARIPAGRRSLSRRILVEMDGTRAAKELAGAVDALSFEIPEYAPRFVILRFSAPGDSLAKLEEVRALAGVAGAKPLLGSRKTRRLLPNDPRFSWSSENNAYQWHLRNTGQNNGIAGIDANVTSVWDNYRGEGITIGLVDDGLQINHPDLASNVNTEIDHDWNDTSPDDPTPSPIRNPYGDFWDHGTAVGGIAAGRGDNGMGITGAAPLAQLVGLKILTADTSEAEDAEALGWRTDVIDISNNSWGQPDDGQRLFTPGALIQAALADGVANGRGGKGTIYVWSCGNGRHVGDYANYDGFVNMVETIGVAAVGHRGRQSFYSESGANVLIAAPSSDGENDQSIVTTSITSNDSYTNYFGGTSAAAPLVSGVVALVLEANPNLGWRDVQEILIRSARKVDAFSSGWSENGAGFHFHHGYGAGMIDAAAAVALAKTWQNLTAQLSNEARIGLARAPIPDGNPTGVSRIFTVSGDDLRIEHVLLTVNIKHPYRGDVVITLTSPSGTVSQFSEEHSDGNADYSNYTMLSVRHWGEMANGQWTIKVSDLSEGASGTLQTASLKVLGTDPNAPPPPPPPPPPVPPTGYDAWITERFPPASQGNPAIVGEFADPDGDHRRNLLEYALESDPLIADTGTGIRTRSDGNNLRASYSLDITKPDITHALKMSSDLTNWSPVNTTVAGTTGTLETREALVDFLSSNRVFMQLEITRSP